MSIDLEHKGCGYLLYRLDQLLTRNEPKLTNEEITRRIITNAGMSDSVSFYSGIGANRKHLDEEKLLKLYKEIQLKLDVSAAYAFANMIFDMPNLAPSNVLINIYNLAENNWAYDPDSDKNFIGTAQDDRPIVADSSEEIYLSVSASLISSGVEDESELIRNSFRNSFDPDELQRIKDSRNILRDKDYNET